jgi:hypothetical protein
VVVYFVVAEVVANLFEKRLYLGILWVVGSPTQRIYTRFAGTQRTCAHYSVQASPPPACGIECYALSRLVSSYINKLVGLRAHFCEGLN